MNEIFICFRSQNKKLYKNENRKKWIKLKKKNFENIKASFELVITWYTPSDGFRGGDREDLSPPALKALKGSVSFVWY